MTRFVLQPQLNCLEGGDGIGHPNVGGTGHFAIQPIRSSWFVTVAYCAGVLAVAYFCYTHSPLYSESARHALDPSRAKFEYLQFPSALNEENPAHMIAVKVHNEMVSVENEYLHHMRAQKYNNPEA
ncbi:hypothetical protein SARC_16647, partial [Sphaeroforma arctica JP610]